MRYQKREREKIKLSPFFRPPPFFSYFCTVLVEYRFDLTGILIFKKVIQITIEFIIHIKPKRLKSTRSVVVYIFKNKLYKNKVVDSYKYYIKPKTNI